MKLREYEYRCKRCGKQFSENVGYPSEMVESHIGLIATPDETDEQYLMETFPSDYYSMVLSSYHKCKDGGIGLGELSGCSAEYELD